MKKNETIGTAQVLEHLTSTGQTSRQIGAAIYGCSPESLSREELEPVSKALSHLKGKGEAIMVRNGTSIMWLANVHEAKQKIVAAVKNETVPAEEADTAAQTLAAIAGTLGHFGIEFKSVEDGVYKVCAENLALSSGISGSREQVTLAEIAGILTKNGIEVDDVLSGVSKACQFKHEVKKYQELVREIESVLKEFGHYEWPIEETIREICEENLAKNTAFPQEKRKLTKLEIAQAIVDAGTDTEELTDLCEAIKYLGQEGYKVVEDAKIETP